MPSLKLSSRGSSIRAPQDPWRSRESTGFSQLLSQKVVQGSGPGHLHAGPWKLISLWILPHPRWYVTLKSCLLLFKCGYSHNNLLHCSIVGERIIRDRQRALTGRSVGCSFVLVIGLGRIPRYLPSTFWLHCFQLSDLGRNLGIVQTADEVHTCPPVPLPAQGPLSRGWGEVGAFQLSLPRSVSLPSELGSFPPSPNLPDLSLGQGFQRTLAPYHGLSITRLREERGLAQHMQVVGSRAGT